MSIRVLIVDDHALFRESLRAVLDGNDGIEVTGDVGTAMAAFAAVESQHPDVVLMDIRLPDIHGLAATETLCAMADPPAVLVLTSLENRDGIFAAMRAGARGYLVKTSPLADLIRAIHAVHAGQTVLDVVASTHMRELGRQEYAGTETPYLGLTFRERQILDLLATGTSTARIAETLNVAEKTVRNYASSLYAKIGAESRSEAVLIAREIKDRRG